MSPNTDRFKAALQMMRNLVQYMTNRQNPIICPLLVKNNEAGTLSYEYEGSGRQLISLIVIGGLKTERLLGLGSGRRGQLKTRTGTIGEFLSAA